ncbi:MAG: DNA double-strand break repair nuclease NurA, partial [Gammaproteobacteria bacterium]
MTTPGYEGYARLPEDLLKDLLDGAGDVVNQVKSLLAPALEEREGLRRALQDLGLVRRYKESKTKSICGIDGGFAVERTAAVDLLLSVAVGVEGLGGESTRWDSTQYLWWASVARHAPDTERLARGVMVAQELAVLANAPHEFRILDGSHLTLVIQLNAALTAFSVDIREEAKRVWEKLETIKTLGAASREVGIVAIPKYDSSRMITELLEKALGRPFPGDDKHLLGLLLEPGEFVLPQTVPADPWDSLHFDARTHEDQIIAQQLELAIEPLKQRKIRFTYFKPTEFSPAFRIELKDGVGETDLNSLFSTLANQITGPFVREPFPQYLADVMAKSVGLGLTALQAAVQ